MQVAELVGMVETMEAIDWEAVELTVGEEDEGWYGDVVGPTMYEGLVDFRRCHLKQIQICGRSKRWWDSDLSEQVKAVRRARRWWVTCGNRNVFRAEVSKVRRLVKEKKDRCWRAFC